jgi:hypothetical protein
MVTSLKMMNSDENLSITNKTNHQTKREKKVQDGGTQVLATEESSKERGSEEELKQIKYLNMHFGNLPSMTRPV